MGNFHFEILLNKPLKIIASFYLEIDVTNVDQNNIHLRLKY